MRYIMCVMICLFVGLIGCQKEESHEQAETPQMDFGQPWVYTNQFHEVIEMADHIVIRDGGFNCCKPSVDDDSVIVEITDPGLIREIYNNLIFSTDQTADACECCGYPGIDWYRGKKRLALTAVQHRAAIRWAGFPGYSYGDAKLTEESSDWMKRWLHEHGINRDYGEF
ncbi:MAG: hypothetical protein ABIF77_19090 [bacterium]